MFEAYKVGVTIALTNHVSRALLGIGRDFNRTDAQAIRLKATLHAIEKTALKGALVGGAGFLGLKAIGAAVKPAEEYVHQLELAKAAGLSQLELAKATGAAWKTTGGVLTTTATENLKAVRELRMVFGGTAEAVEFLPQGQKMQAVLDSVLHGKGGVQAKDVAFTAFRALELRGASGDKKAMAEQADLIVKGVIASGGKFTPNMLLQAQKYAGAAGMNFSNDFMYGILPTLVQEMGGSSTGTMLTSMSQAVVGGRIDKKALPYWLKYGFAKNVKGVTGETAMIEATNAEMFQDSPFKYMQYVDAELKKAGFKSQKERSAILGRMFRNRTSERAANLLAEQGPRLEKDFNLIGQAGTSGEYDRLVKSDPVMARQAAAAQWENLKTVVGLEVVPILLPAIRGLATGLHGLSDWFKVHPNITKGLVYGLTALSGALLFSGTVLTLKAAFLGLNAVMGVGGMAGILGAATGAGLVANVAALGTSLALLAAPVATLLAVLKYHGNVAAAIDDTSLGRRVGDGLMRLRDAWNDPSTGAAAAFSPPRKNASTPQASGTLRVENGQLMVDYVTKGQEKAMNKPSSGTGTFDIGKTMASPSASFAQ